MAYEHKMVGGGVTNAPSTNTTSTVLHRDLEQQLAPYGGALDRRSQGQLVARVQRSLQGQGYYCGHKVDGEYGPATKEAVKQFQLDKKLVVDGIVGPDTLKALLLPGLDNIYLPKQCK